ncbi:DUF29 family protein [Argonema antarcticum]|uniref:DUF29 family protein n=1 Tax=Argonema antarcticum TaxID=2942763 RepID=UPI0020110167|nr:DUF29 family protein [Argonema antarcticum]MCL1474469.1 DUF29 domain-containing protein [Argonema antarcticum A004/B2]
MTQELLDLRNCILEGRYDDAFSLLDELDGMSKKAILRNIKKFLIRMLVHLIKNQVEQRLTNSWYASIRDSILEIQDLNIKENKISYYIKEDEWEEYLSQGFEDAIVGASVEAFDGRLTPSQVKERIDKTVIIATATKFLNLTYSHSPERLREAISEEVTQLAGGEDWKLGN